MDVGLLPDVIVLEIFRYLPYVDLCKAAQVCSRWRRISRDKSLHRVINIRDKSLPWNLIHKFIKFHCSEELVDVAIALNNEPLIPQRRATIYNSIRCLALLNTRSPNLKYLSLNQATVRLSLYSCIKYVPNSVTHFSLGFNHFNDMRNPRKPKLNVEYLAVRYCTFQTAVSLNFLNCFPNLTQLHMCQVDFDNYNILRCPPLKDKGRHLRILNLEGNSEYDDFYVAFVNCVSLEELYLGHNRQAVDDEMLQHGPELPNLHTLCVVSTEVKQSMDTYVKKFPKLKTFFSGERKDQCHHFQ